MDDTPSPQDAARLLGALRHRQELSRRILAGQELPAEKALFRAWQAQRLARTHADLLASARYGPACRFFLEEIYAAKDFSQRNHDLVRMHNFMMRFLPAGIIRTLTLAIELNALTEELDEKLLRVLVEELGVKDEITPEQYAEGYRICDNYEERVQQIEMIMAVGQGIDRLVRLPLVGWTLRLARRPARRSGWQELQTFLERGFKAFKHMGDATYFLETIKRREMQILNQIFAGDDDPFHVDE